jgi:hypothetical protein
MDSWKLSGQVDPIGAEISAQCSGRERNVTFAVISYEEARQLEPLADSWITLAQNETLGVHAFVLENGPELPKDPGPRAEEVGDVIHEMHTEVCSSLRESKISGSDAETESGTQRAEMPDPSDKEDEEMTYS